MTVTRGPFSQNLSIQVIQCRKQGHRAVPVIVVSASSHLALAQRQSGLGSLQSLALNYLNGKILAERAPRHRHQEWLKFLKTIDSSTPAGVDLHLILDNYATHKHPKVMRWLAAHPRFHLHFTPTSASWLNLVERFFRDLSQDVILPGSFGSTNELVDAIWGYLAERNLKPQRYQWRADGTVILEKIRRAREALARSQPIVKD